ncbi:MAG: alpha/beta hydrolase [archaeon]
MTFLKTKDGFNIYYEFLKRDKHKLVLIFVHGWMMNWTCFKKEIEHFKRKGHSVLYLDLRGHGKSDKPEQKKDYSLHKMQDDLFQILKKEKIKEIILIGHSMGGMVSALFTLKHQKIIKKLILIDSSYKNPFFSLRIPLTKKHVDFAKMIGNFATKKSEISKHFKQIKDLDFSKMEDKAEIKIVFDAIINTPLHVVFGALEAMFDYDLTNRLKEIKKPVLVIGSSMDHLFSKKIQSSMSEKLNAKLTIKKGTHAIIIKKPEEIIKEIETFI